jgi:hypothetical protein
VIIPATGIWQLRDCERIVTGNAACWVKITC